MKALDAERMKAAITRAMLTCRCGHSQTDHILHKPQGMIVGDYTWCGHAAGCACKHFQPMVTAIEKRDMDRMLDRKVDAGRLAAILKDQPLPRFASQTPQGESSTAPVVKRIKGKRQGRKVVRIESAPQAKVSHIYHGVPRTRPDGKPIYEEL